MKKIIYFVMLVVSMLYINSVKAQAPENVDIGVFPVGTYPGTSPGEVLEVALKTDMLLTTTGGEFTVYLEIPTALFTGNEVWNITEENMGPGVDLIYQFTFQLPAHPASTIVSFVSSAAPLPLSLLNPINTWKFSFTITLTGTTNITPQDIVIADQNSDLWAEFAQRSTLLAIVPPDNYNELLPVSSMPALPLDLILFNAQKFQERSAKLDWTTVNEINTSNFVVERSYDKKHWNSIGSVKAAGMSINAENYSFVDVNVYNGIDSRLSVYYRLTMVDLDGRFKLSPIQSVVFGTGGSKSREFVIYPNPASDGLQVEWDSQRDVQPTTLEFFDIQGKLVLTQKVSDHTNQEYVDFSKSTIQPGLYLLRILNGSEPLDHKQVVVGQR